MKSFGDILTMKEIKHEYDFHINRAFVLMTLIDNKKNWDGHALQQLYERLIDVQAEARRLDGLRFQIAKGE